MPSTTASVCEQHIALRSMGPLWIPSSKGGCPTQNTPPLRHLLGGLVKYCLLSASVTPTCECISCRVIPRQLWLIYTQQSRATTLKLLPLASTNYFYLTSHHRIASPQPPSSLLKCVLVPCLPQILYTRCPRLHQQNELAHAKRQASKRSSSLPVPRWYLYSNLKVWGMIFLAAQFFSRTCLVGRRFPPLFP